MNRILLWMFPLLAAVLAGCATSPGPTTAAVTATGPAAEPERQYMCVSAVYVSEATRAQTVSQGDLVAPIGEWLARQLAARFWVDAALRSTGRPQPSITAGFAPGTGVRPAGLGRGVEAQAVLQFQVMKPTGQAYYETVGGRATAATLDQASAQALLQAVDRMESVLVTAGLCRRVL